MQLTVGDDAKTISDNVEDWQTCIVSVSYLSKNMVGQLENSARPDKPPSRTIGNNDGHDCLKLKNKRKAVYPPDHLSSIARNSRGCEGGSVRSTCRMGRCIKFINQI